LHIFLIFLFVIALIFSYTRAAWISLILAFGFFLGMFIKLRLRIIFTIIGVLVGIFFLFKTEITISLERNRQDSSKNLSKHIKSITNISSDASNMERINRWKCAVRMFKERPLFGFGPGTYMFKYAPYQLKSEETIISTNAGLGGNAHSEYLGPLSESGLFSTITFLAIIITTLTTASRIYFRTKKRKVRIMALTLLIALLTYYFHGIVNNFLDSDKLSALFWGFTAMIVALDVYHHKEVKQNKIAIEEQQN
jgi:putative inorganic carbon (hco3(-)) transporter